MRRMSRTPWSDQNAAPPVSLQSRLDAIAHDRAVLAVARTLAERGLMEGTHMQRASAVGHGSDSLGRLEITRDNGVPRAVIRRNDGGIEAFAPEHWVPLAGDRSTSNAA